MGEFDKTGGDHEHIDLMGVNLPDAEFTNLLVIQRLMSIASRNVVSDQGHDLAIHLREFRLPTYFAPEGKLVELVAEYVNSWSQLDIQNFDDETGDWRRIETGSRQYNKVVGHRHNGDLFFHGSSIEHDTSQHGMGALFVYGLDQRYRARVDYSNQLSLVEIDTNIVA